MPSSKIDFDPDEPPAFGQVWQWGLSGPLLLLAPASLWGRYGSGDWYALTLDLGNINLWAGLHPSDKVDGWERVE